MVNGIICVMIGAIMLITGASRDVQLNGVITTWGVLMVIGGEQPCCGRRTPGSPDGPSAGS